MDDQTVLTDTTDYAASAVSMGDNKELTEIREMMKQLVAEVNSQAAIVATLSTKINGGSAGAGRNIDNKKARPGLHVCKHRKRGVYHRDTNCLDLDPNKEKRYPGWKSVSNKEYYELGCVVSGVGEQN